MSFTQALVVRAADGDALSRMAAEWHAAEAGVAPGYLGSRLLADRDDPSRFVLIVDFTSVEAAELNNDRPETAAWAARLLALVDGDPEYYNYDETYRT